MLNHIAHRRANGTPSDELRQLAKALYRAYNMSPQRHELTTGADTPAGSKSQDDDLISVGEAASSSPCLAAACSGWLPTQAV